ncbi:MAG: hypothetical protein GY757_19565, partial [bacterium]|nr:hypothetical protein [bacterium]
MITRKPGEPFVALFMHWEILKNYHLLLEDLDIPIEEFRDSGDFENVFGKLTAKFKKNLARGAWGEHKELAQKIEDDIDKIVIPGFLMSDCLKELLEKDCHGTFFIVFDPHEQLQLLSGEDRIEINDDSATRYLRSSLSGLYNGFEERKDTEDD